MKYIGDEYEKIASDYLQTNNVSIIKRNYAQSGGEIDIIARDADSIIFVEVKGRKNNRYGAPSEYVTKQKQIRIIKTAEHFLQEQKLSEAPCRFDVISIVKNTHGDIDVDWIKNAFSL